MNVHAGSRAVGDARGVLRAFAFAHSSAGTHASFVTTLLSDEPGDGQPAMPIERRHLVQILVFWTFLGVLTALNGVMDPRGRGLQPLLPGAPVALAFVQCYLWAAVTPLVFWLCSRYTVERSNWLARVVLYVAVGLVVANLVSIAIDFLRFDVLYAPREPRPGRVPFEPGVLDGIRRLWWLDDFIVFIAILATGFARDYFLRYQLRRDEAALLQTQSVQLQAQLVEARLSALRTQLNPHFLFNTLNAVSALVERDPRGVRRMIARLSELLRYSLDSSNEAEVPLARELAFLDRYIEIMQIRFQGRVHISQHIDDNSRDAMVPNLILQTLVENALKHGVSQQDGSGSIELSTLRNGDSLVMRVRDHGPGLSPTATPSAVSPSDSGIGLRNTRARLEQLYGAESRLTLSAAQGGGAIAEVVLPYHTENDLRTTGEMSRP